MDVIVLIGRLLLALVFVVSGIMGHLAGRKMLAPYAQSQGVPAAATLVPLSGAVIVIGGLMVALGIWGDLGALLLAAFLAATNYYMHAFWKLDDQAERVQQMNQFNKNLGLIGGALLVFALFAGTDVGLTVTGPLFNLD